MQKNHLSALIGRIVSSIIIILFIGFAVFALLLVLMAII